MRARPIAVIFFVLGLSSFACAGTFVARLPESFVRATGAPTAVDRAFTVLDPTTTFTLVIHNGGLNNEFPRISSAVVSVNGTEVAGPRDFNQQVSVIQKAVTLQATNTLTVELRSGPGSGFTLEILGVDNVPPTITASADRPPNAAGWYNANVVVSFTCFDKTSGVANCPSPVTVSTEAANQIITGTAIDNAGNMATAQVAISLDKTPPVLRPIVSPSPNAGGGNNTDVTVSFTATDSPSGVASVTAPVVVTAEGRGQIITGTARDVAGNQATA